VQGYPLLPNLGPRDAAMISYRKAANLAERVNAGNRSPESRRLVARCHQRIAAMLRASAQTKASIEEYKRVLAEAEPLLGSNPIQPEDAELLNTVLLTLGQAQAVAGNVAEASRLWLRSVSMREALASAKGADPLQMQLARTHKYMIRALMYAGDLEAAERTAIEGVRVREIAAGRQPGNAALRRDLGNSYGELAYVYFHPAFLSFGDREKAAMFQRKSLEIARELAASDPQNATAQTDLDITEVDLCAALVGIAPAKAAGYCRDSLGLAARWPQLSADAGLAQLADALTHMGRYREALQTLRSATQIRLDMSRRDPGHFVLRQHLLRGYNQMAGLLLSTGDPAAALEQHLQAVALAEQLAAAIPDNLLAQRDLADTYEAFGKYFEHRDWSQARMWYQKSLDIWTGWPRIGHAGRMDQARRLNAQRLITRCL
jgi:tetratricopeptide (TPR) repeat protein